MVALVTVIAFVGVIVGIVGIIVPVLPGSTLMGASLAVWAVVVPSWPGRICAISGIVVLIVTAVLQYVVAGKRLKSAGVPNSTLLVGAVFGIAGMFVVPVVGLLLGFILGTVLAETVRNRQFVAALPSAWAALKAAIVSVAVDLTGASVAATLWLVGAFLARDEIISSGQGWLFPA